MKNPCSLTLLLTLCLAGPASAEPAWLDLFNGTNIDGWVEHSGKAKYSVVEGVLVGASVSGSGNSFLCTTQTFGDFELELEFKCDALLNSGVQIRSEVFPTATTTVIEGKQHKFAADRVHGYQCEIDMDAARGRMWTGGIFDEARRGWLFPADGQQGQQGRAFSEQGRKVSKSGEWNKLRVVANGPSIKTWLNGEPRAEITDSLTPRGIIGLQVHGVGQNTSKVGLTVSFRNLRLREIKPDSASAAPNTLTEAEKAKGWQLLWDGKSTDGWRSVNAEKSPTKVWTIQDGVLSVRKSGGEGSGAGGDLMTRKRYANFEFSADFKVTPGANSGIKIFAQTDLSSKKKAAKPEAGGPAIGLEFQILDDARHPDAKRGLDGNRTVGSLYDLIPAPKSKTVSPVGEWNQARIVSQDSHVEFWLNGQKTVAFERGSPEFRAAVAQSKFGSLPKFGEWADGYILLQDHGNEVSFRNVKIRELDPK